MPTRIDKLTPKQEAMMPMWAKKWIDIGLKTGETDWDTFEKYIKVCYEKANIPFPNKIIRVQSPIVGAFASAIADGMLTKKGSGAVRDAVGVAVGGAVEGAVRDAVGGAVRDAVGVAVGGAVEDAVGGAVRDAVGVAVGGAVEGNKIAWHYWLGGQMWVGYWYGSPSMTSFFFEVCKLELSKDITERAEAYRKICESVNYIWPNRNFVMVCARPKHIDRNAQGRLHSDKRKAIEYPDGWGLYYLNGVKFEEELWQKIVSKQMPYEDILKIADVDQRAQALKYGDWEKFTLWQNAIKIDEFTKFDVNGNEVPHQLWEFPLQTDETKRIFSKKVHFARYICPSTREWKIKGVLEFKTVAESMAWGMSDDENIMSPEMWKQLIPLMHES